MMLQIDYQRGHYEFISHALLVKMQIELASHLKRQKCKNCEENTKW